MAFGPRVQENPPPIVNLRLHYRKSRHARLGGLWFCRATNPFPATYFGGGFANHEYSLDPA